MRTLILGPDRKPSIWPIPEDCTWNGEIYDIKDSLRLSVHEEFIREAEIFSGLLQNVHVVRAEISGDGTGVKILKYHEGRIHPEGYVLDVTDTGVVLHASARDGVFRGLMTLLQLLENSPPGCILGVHIVDKPAKNVRGVRISWPVGPNIPRFTRFIDFLAKYKINKIVLDAPPCEGLSQEEMNHLTSYLKARYVELIADDWVLSAKDGAIVLTDGEDDGKNVYEILKMSCMTWWGGYRPDNTVTGNSMPECLERTVAQLYPLERDILCQSSCPSRTNKQYKTLEIRKFYNAPLHRLSWLHDDYNYMYLTQAQGIPNTVPFSLFQGVHDYKLQNALVLGGNDWNQGVSGIPVSLKLRGLVFLHSYLVDSTEGDIVGHYVVHYGNGTTERVEIAYGRTIFHWRTDVQSGKGAYFANPVFKGMTSYHAPYTIYAQEFINPRPDIEVTCVDVIPAESHGHGGIALFGITAVQ